MNDLTKKLRAIVVLAAALTFTGLFLFRFFAESSELGKLLAMFLFPGILVAIKMFRHSSVIVFFSAAAVIQILYSTLLLFLVGKLRKKGPE